MKVHTTTEDNKAQVKRAGSIEKCLGISMLTPLSSMARKKISGWGLLCSTWSPVTTTEKLPLVEVG
jgi:hypothetical protein